MAPEFVFVFFLIAVVTNDHKLSGLNNIHKSIISQFYRSEVQDGSHQGKIKVLEPIP